MSRGLGEQQRFVLEMVGRRPRNWHTAGRLAYQRYGAAPTTAQLESIRRAIRTLAARDLVDTQHTDFHEIGMGRQLEVRARG